MATNSTKFHTLAGFACIPIVLSLTTAGYSQQLTSAPIVQNRVQFQPLSLYSVRIQNFDNRTAFNAHIDLELEGHQLQYLRPENPDKIRNLDRTPIIPQDQVGCRPTDKGAATCKIKTLEPGESVVLHFVAHGFPSEVVPNHAPRNRSSENGKTAASPHFKSLKGALRELPSVRALFENRNVTVGDVSLDKNLTQDGMSASVATLQVAVLDPQFKGIRSDCPDASPYSIGFDSSNSLSDVPLKIDVRNNGGAKLAISISHAELQSHLCYLEEAKQWVLESEFRFRPSADVDSSGLSLMHEILREHGWSLIHVDANTYFYRFRNHYPQPPQHWLSTDSRAIELLPVPVRLDSWSSLIIDAPVGMIVDTFPRAHVQESLLRNRRVRQQISLGSFPIDECPHVAVAVASTVDEIQNSPGYLFLKSKALALVGIVFGTILGFLSNRVTTVFSRRTKRNIGFGAGRS